MYPQAWVKGKWANSSIRNEGLYINHWRQIQKETKISGVFKKFFFFFLFREVFDYMFRANEKSLWSFWIFAQLKKKKQNSAKTIWWNVARNWILRSHMHLVHILILRIYAMNDKYFLTWPHLGNHGVISWRFTFLFYNHGLNTDSLLPMSLF